MTILKHRPSVLLIVILSMSLMAIAQPGKKVPPFRMLQSNGKTFKAENLPMGKPIVIIYFSPDCDHCETLMKAFIKQRAVFAKASVAMITYLPVAKVAAFEKKYDLKKYLDVYTGTEGTTYFVKNYYKLTEMPFVALYNKSGSFIKSYSRDIPLKELTDKLKTLK